jgi:hypothetical protein
MRNSKTKTGNYNEDNAYFQVKETLLRQQAKKIAKDTIPILLENRRIFHYRCAGKNVTF